MDPCRTTRRFCSAGDTMKGLLSSRFTFLGVLLVLTGLLSACGGSSGGGSGGGTPATSGVTLEVTDDPQVTWLNTNGRTQVIVQFSARDNNGLPLTEDQIDVEFELDGNPIDVESLLNQGSTQLEVNLYFAMVLDASFSMTQHDPPAFEPMKSAARDSFQRVLNLWDTRPGEVEFSLIWFDEIMNQSTFNIGTARDWAPDDILSIPDPAAGTATKLYSAVETMASYLQSEYDSSVFNGERDQYVMLVFTDGEDNFSFWDNSSINVTRSTSSGASYQQFGTLPTTLEAAIATIAAHPKLTTHTIGFSADTNADELRQIAEAGSLAGNEGVFQEERLTANNIDELFERVLREFTTIQTRGAEIPLPPGDYDFTVTVTNRSGGNSDSYEFRIHAGDPQAGLLTSP